MSNRRLLGVLDTITMDTIKGWNTVPDEAIDQAKIALAAITNNEIEADCKLGVRKHGVSRIANSPVEDKRMYWNFVLAMPDKPGVIFHVFEGTREIARWDWDPNEILPKCDNVMFFGDKMIDCSE